MRRGRWQCWCTEIHKEFRHRHVIIYVFTSMNASLQCMCVARTLGLHIKGIEENSRAKRESLFQEDECIVQINDAPLQDKTFTQWVCCVSCFAYITNDMIRNKCIFTTCVYNNLLRYLCAYFTLKYGKFCPISAITLLFMFYSLFMWHLCMRKAYLIHMQYKQTTLPMVIKNI